MSDMQGRRRDPDVDVLDYEPGDYGKRRMQIGDDTHEAWWYRAPNGALGRLKMSFDGLPCHEVEEHEDGTITVERHPENSNSILVTSHASSWHLLPGEPTTWHGYLYRGVWRSI